MLSEDDLDLREMTPEELERAWDLWFDLAQSTNDADPPYTHGVLVLVAAGRPEVPADTAKDGRRRLRIALASNPIRGPRDGQAS